MLKEAGREASHNLVCLKGQTGLFVWSAMKHSSETMPL